MCAEPSNQRSFIPELDSATSHGLVRPNLGSQAGDSFSRSLLALSRQRGIGTVAIQSLIREFPDLEELWQSDPARLAKALSSAHVPSAQPLARTLLEKRTALLQEGERELQEIYRQHISILGRGDPRYPGRFFDLRNPPFWLFVDGKPEILNRFPFVAVIGTREATNPGIRAAQVVTMAAAESGYGLVSGLAEGIDAAAHEMASRFEMPQVGILGTGIKVIFPKSTAHLRRSIIETRGVVITECLPNENYGKAQFVQRNRLQAALASVVAPVEGSAASGTAHTLRFAMELNRPLVGVSHGGVKSENEILIATLRAGASSYDLSQEEDRDLLKLALSKFPGERWQGYRRPDASILYRRVRSAWKDVASFTEASESEKLRLVQLFLEDLGLRDFQVVKRSDD